MKRSKPIARTSSLKRSRMRRRIGTRAPELRDEPYLQWIRKQPCCACDKAAPSHAHHVTGAGLALKAHDRDTMPVCPSCHDDLHRFAGRFEGFSRADRATWQWKQIAHFQALYARTEAA